MRTFCDVTRSVPGEWQPGLYEAVATRVHGNIELKKFFPENSNGFLVDHAVDLIMKPGCPPTHGIEFTWYLDWLWLQESLVLANV